MSDNNPILIVGGDKRLQLLGIILFEKGYACHRENADSYIALKKAEDAAVIVLPIPVSKDGENVFSDNTNLKVPLADLCAKLHRGQVVIGGSFSAVLRKELDCKDIRYYDLTDSEEFTVYNAFLTAQGALKLLLDNTQTRLQGKKVLVTGFGRVAKALCMALKGLNMQVFVAARSSLQLCEAGCLGYEARKLNDINKEIYLFDYIFNTVPHICFSASDIRQMNDGCVYFELASSPFGASVDDFCREGKMHIPASALPGKYTAYSAAEIIAGYVEDFIKRGETYG